VLPVLKVLKEVRDSKVQLGHKVLKVQKALKDHRELKVL
jgi:hypothetical protein